MLLSSFALCCTLYQLIIEPCCGVGPVIMLDSQVKTLRIRQVAGQYLCEVQWLTDDRSQKSVCSDFYPLRHVHDCPS